MQNSEIIQKLRQIEKDDSAKYNQRDMANAVRARLEKLEANYLATINDCLADLEMVGIKMGGGK